MNSAPYYFQDSESGQALHLLDAANNVFNEAWLQEFIRKNPESLPVASIEPVYAPLTPIGREVLVSNGLIDNLYISKQGYPVLVETKLWRNPEAKREVLTQIFEYGSSLSKMTFDELDQITRNYARTFEGQAWGLFDWVEQSFGPLDVDRLYFEETVSKNLRLGRFLILVVGDRIRPSLVETLSFMNRYPHLAVDVALVELLFYKVDSQRDWPMVVVPNLLARTEIVERSIVQVNVDVSGRHTVEVSQETAANKPGSKRREKLASEEAFWEILKANAPADYEVARQVVSHFQANEFVRIEPKEASLALYLELPDSGQRLSLFFIDIYGKIKCWPMSIAEQVERAGYDTALVGEYEQELREVLRIHTRKLSIHEQARNVDVDAFNKIVMRFIEKILQSEPKIS